MIFLFLTSGLFLGWALGANDAANVFGTAVGSRMLKFKTAVITGSIFVVIGAVLQGAGASDTLGELGNIPAIAAAFTVALSAAVAVFGMIKRNLPSSTSQAIVGSIIGWNFYVGNSTDTNVLFKIVSTWVSGPVLGALFSFLFFMIIKKVSRSVKIHILYRDAFIRLGLILVGAFGAYSLGANNIANVMGVFVGSVNFPDVNILGFVLESKQQLFFIGGLAIALGIMTYSKRVMKTVGQKLMPLSPDAALVVVLAQASVLFIFSSKTLSNAMVSLGLPPIPLVPVSSSQVVIGAIIGVGLYKGGKEIKYGILGKIALGWITTPLTAGIISFFMLFFMNNVFNLDVGKQVGNQNLNHNKNLQVSAIVSGTDSAQQLKAYDFRAGKKENSDKKLIGDYFLPGITIVSLFTALIFIYLFLLKRKENFVLQKGIYSLKRRNVELQKLEPELETLKAKSQKLDEELKFKHDEMVTMAMSIIRKNEFLDRLKKQIIKHKSRINDKEAVELLNGLLMMIVQNISADHECEKFRMHLNELHSDFLKRLSEEFPGMTNNEKRLAAMLRLNLSSKEIASILNISPKSVEMNRYRLRKKLKVPAKMTLNDFIGQF